MDTSKLDKDKVYEIMRELLFSFNYLSFQLELWMRDECHDLFNNKKFRELYHKFGSYEANRLSRAVPTTGTGINNMILLLKHSHWSVFETIDIIEVSNSSFKMRTINCSVQRAAQKKWGMPYYDCSTSGYILRDGFFKQINPHAEVQRIHTPPQTNPQSSLENVSCEWLISLNKESSKASETAQITAAKR